MSEFTDYLAELFEQFGPVQARRMFGGYGIYHEGLMFGLVANDTLYLKADETTAQDYESRGLGRFAYEKGDKIVHLSYYLAPEEILDSPENAAHWARLAYAVAVRAQARARRPGKHRRGG